MKPQSERSVLTGCTERRGRLECEIASSIPEVAGYNNFHRSTAELLSRDGSRPPHRRASALTKIPSPFNSDVERERFYHLDLLELPLGELQRELRLIQEHLDRQDSPELWMRERVARLREDISARWSRS